MSRTSSLLLILLFLLLYVISENTVEAKKHENFGVYLKRKTLEAIKGVAKVIEKLDTNTTSFDGKKATVLEIYPGTKWCGYLNIAKTKNDLGTFSTVDKCCRDHDLCPDIMEPGEKKNGLVNIGSFRKSHCRCDSRLYQCLKEAGGVVANNVGYVYFTILRTRCFKMDYATVPHLHNRKRKCNKKVTDKSGKRMYQWFDNPPF